LSCGYVWQEPLVPGLPEEEAETIRDMLRAFIRDIDDGKSLSESGWIPLNDAMIKRLSRSSFCEIDYENRTGRVNPNGELPNELASTDEGTIFSDYMKALRVLDSTKVIRGNYDEYRKAVVTGLIRMLESAQYNLWEKDIGSMPDKIRRIILNPQWMRIARKSAELLVKELLENLWGPDVTAKVFGQVVDVGTNSSIVREALMWEKVIEFFREKIDLIENLGLIWNVDQRIEKEGIEYLGARVLLFEKVLEKNKWERLENLGERLEESISGNGWRVNWSDIFYLPF
jgi:hypothetical protein